MNKKLLLKFNDKISKLKHNMENVNDYSQLMLNKLINGSLSDFR